MAVGNKNDFERNKNMFLKVVKQVRKDDQGREKLVKDVNIARWC